MSADNTETATLAGGCFWCIDTIFRELKGVEKVESGYAGGQYPNPTYRDVCSGMTGHAEVVRVTFDPTVLSFRDLLGVFFTIQVIDELNRNKVWDDPIVTQVVPVTNYSVAETYHQDYYVQNPDQGYCQIVIAPKVAKFRKAYLDRLRR